MKRIRVLPGLVILLMVSGPALALTIDDFTQGSFNLAVDEDGVNVPPETPQTDFLITTDSKQETGLNTSNVLGGQRNTTLTFDSKVDGGTDVTADLFPSPGYVILDQDTGFTAHFELEYGLGGNLDADLTDGGASAGLTVVFGVGTDAVADVTVTAETWNGTIYNSSALQKVQDVNGGGYMTFPYASFVGSGDFTDVDRLSILLQGAMSGDYQIDLETTGLIPEPVTMAGLMLGIGALGGYIRRRKA